MPIFLKTNFLFMAIFLMLTGCSLFSPVKNENASVYLINATPKTVMHKRGQGYNLLVPLPEINPVYNTLQIAYTTRPYQVDYFIKSHWAETPSQMFQPLIIEALRNTHYYRVVGSSAAIGHYDFALITHIIELQQDYSKLPYRLHLVLRAELIRMSDGKVIAGKEFSISEGLPQNSPYGGIIAANRATAKILGQLVAFCLNKTTA